MNRSAPSLVSAFVGDLAALAGAALLVVDGRAVLAGGPLTALAPDLSLIAAGIVAHALARSRWREGPTVALAALILGAGPAVVLAHRWWLAAAAGAGVAVLAPHLLVPRRSRVWVVAGALLGVAAAEAGRVLGLLVPLVLLATGFLSLRLARCFSGSSGRLALKHEQAIETERRRAAGLEAQVARFRRGESEPHHSFARVAFSRRLGVIGAIASAMARDLRLAGAAGEERLRLAASRCAGHADHLARLASGGAAREEETTLALLWPRLSEAFGGRVRPSHRVEWKVPADLPPVAGSSSEWVQILCALAENALHAMPDSGVLTIEAVAADVPGRARVIVADNGVGIPPDLLPHVLEPFRTSHAEGGAEGLGLALVASMVEALGGGIIVDSAQGRGTRVEIEVPFYAAAAAPAIAPIRFEGTVLLADDSREMRSALRRLLESFGLEVVEADSGTVALAHFAAAPSRFRALLLDVVMPGTPVEEVVVRAREMRPDVPVVLISGYNVEGHLENLVALGGVRFLSKPLVREQLVSTLRDLFTVGAR